jgi:hypothetical protein
MTAAEKIKFVNENESAEYFEKDADLYRKLYPSSRLIPELGRANQYNKKHLDGRMLLEILEVVCGETVLENRGIVKSAVPAPFDIEKFKVLDLQGTTYQARKDMVKALQITTKNQKNETLLIALKAKQIELNTLPGEPVTEEPGSEEPAPGEPGSEAPETEEQKKSEAAPE